MVWFFGDFCLLRNWWKQKNLKILNLGFYVILFSIAYAFPFFFVTGVGSRQSNYLEVIFIFAWN